MTRETSGMGVRLSSGAASHDDSQHVDNPSAPSRTDVAAPGDGRTPGTRMDRREAIKWMMAATAALSVADARSFAAVRPVNGYGTDPNLNEAYKAGDLWPLTFTREQRRAVRVLCDLIIPADDKSPSASQLQVPDFIDEWVSAPYPRQKEDGKEIIEGLKWLDKEAKKRFRSVFADLREDQQRQICDEIASEKRAKRTYRTAARFFARFRDLTASAFYTTPEGMKDIQYVGNVPLQKFDGPPREVLAYLKLS